jgi:ComF family protein
MTHTRRVLCAFNYRQAAPVKLVKMFKYDFVKSAHGVLAGLLIEFLEKQDGLPKAPLVVAVPLHAKRRRWRGYNQSSLLAKSVAEHFGWQHDERALLRHKATRPQAKMETGARRLNVDGCFSVRNGKVLKGKRILLVDDVITTGATIEACALALKRAGAQSVDALALVRG